MESPNTAIRETSAVPAAVEHDPVNHPSHYTNHPSGIECITVTRLLGFDIGNATKYVWRRGDKGNAIQDLDKALFYLDDACVHARRNRKVPRRAARLLFRVADAEPDPLAAQFYRAVAHRRWHIATAMVQALRYNA
ncbi:DUF3310 domain-containing protein [Mycolicibacterium aubagnense]|uniref:DUF3310 domain-containing protein n=1 Tax=Mycolicibacterium aubagnense TaxID=319707 RepID=A0ABN5Z1P9_9MYCO|nr:DUF3310 domain-containing protein [Mycolicibacterium aubagnense]TLH64231.1 hypothetical protein C1S80_12510 [Mycolicibacterium aubagnense]BBX87868.1 hypothetical protein MAUB_57410 [Mycolicibacterium aubagnense]